MPNAIHREVKKASLFWVHYTCAKILVKLREKLGLESTGRTGVKKGYHFKEEITAIEKLPT